MSDRDPIVDLFESKLRNAEFEVDPSVWTNIASQIPAASATAVGGLTLTSKLVIAASSIAAIAITSVSIYLFNNTEEESNSLNPVIVEKNILEDSIPESTDKRVVARSIDNSDELETVLLEQPKNSGQEAVVSNERNEVLTINTIDQIIEQDKLVQEDQLIKDFIDIKEEESRREEDTTIDFEEEVINTEEITEEFSKEIEVIIPNVFTPNNDGQNDFYFVTFDGVINNVSVVIFNNTGEVVFKSSDANFKWDGRNMYGDPCISGKYIFMMTGEDQNGNEVLKNRDFQLLR